MELRFQQIPILSMENFKDICIAHNLTEFLPRVYVFLFVALVI